MKIILLSLFLTFNCIAQDTQYHKAIFKASHNSYAKKISLTEQIQTHKFNAIEFDIRRKKFLKSAPEGDWFVFHHLFDRKTQFKYLSDALDILVEYQNKTPDHPILTVFMDMSSFSKKQTPEKLNALLLSKLGSHIFKPKDLLSFCKNTQTLQKAVSKCGWPTLKQLKGKIIFVLTSGDLNDYLKQSSEAVAFVASKPKKVVKDSVFMNIAYDQNFKGLDELQKRNIVTRFYFVDNKKEFKDSYKKKVNFIAIDLIDSKKYPWHMITN